MLLHYVHTPLIAANFETGGSPLVGCSQAIQNIRIYNLYVARPSLPSITWGWAMQRRRDHRFWANKIWLSELQCNFKERRKRVYLWGSLSMYSRRWLRNLNPKFEGMMLTPPQNFIFSFYNSVITIRTNECTQLY